MLLISTLWMDSIALASNPTCPATNLNGKGCSTVTSSSDCTSSYMPPSSTTSTGTICSWNGNSCTDGGGSCTAPPTSGNVSCPTYNVDPYFGCSSINSSTVVAPETAESFCLNNWVSNDPAVAGPLCAWSNNACIQSQTNCYIPPTDDAAQAASTNCAGNSSGWPVYNNGANQGKEAQICGNGYYSMSLAIGGLDTQTWYSNVPSGSGVGGIGNWSWYDGCYYVNDNNVGVTTTGTATINPWSATATNWLAPYTGNSQTRQWASGALWGTGTEVNSTTGVGDWFWSGGTGTSSGLYGAEQPLWTHGCSSIGQITVYNYYYKDVNPNSNSSYASVNALQAASAQDNSDIKLLAHSTAAPASSKQNREIEIIEKEVKLPSDYNGGKIAGLAASCPKGFILMDASLLSSVPVISTTMIDSAQSGIKVSGISAMAGKTLKTQILCRKASLPKTVKGGHYWGTPRNDILEEQKDALHYYGGPGNDTITASINGAHVQGGLGNDIIKISGKDSVGIGGRGDDKLTAVGDTRMRLEGGAGKDKLFGDIGISILDARDGHGGDQVTCSGTKNIALVDKGDIVKGACERVIRSTD
jgi:hypothetical protein